MVEVGTYRDPMLALTLEAAKNGAIIAVVVLVALAIAAAWLMKSIAQKVALAVVLGLLAILIWTQRASLDDCANRVEEAHTAGTLTDTTCTFLGQDISVTTS
jgi:membrane protein implicated in regulation of membrane protease activity